MSLGSFGDIVQLLELANGLWQRFADAPAEFQALLSDVQKLTHVVDSVKVLLPVRDLPANQRQQLVDVLKDCVGLLNQMQEKLDENLELGTNHSKESSFRETMRQARKRLFWGSKDIEDFRSRLSGYLEFLNALYAQLNRHDSLQIKETTSEIREKQIAQAEVIEHEAILEWLTPIEHSCQHSDHSSRRQAGTGGWLLTSEVFQKWVAKPGQTMFCPGIPGAGKTMMASAVIDHLFEYAKTTANLGIAYIYGSFRQTHGQEPVDVLSSLLKQLLQNRASFPEEVRQVYRSKKHTGTRLSIKEISDLFHAVVKQYTRCYIVIDAVDECRAQDTGYKELPSALRSIQIKSKMNLLATSRSIPELMDYFKEKLRCSTIRIQAKNEDVRRYLKGRLSRLPEFVAKDRDLQKEILVEIPRNIDGMFLLAKLHLDSLQGKRSAKAIRTALHALRERSDPQADDKGKPVDFIYEQAMERIEGQIGDQGNIGKEVLNLISSAKRHLKASELQHGLAIEKGTDAFDKSNVTDLKDLVSACAGLVTVDEANNAVRFVHYTTQDFFKRTHKRWFPDAAAYMTNLCITCLSYETNTDACLFYDYAVHNLDRHARKGSGDRDSILDFLMNDAKRIRAFNWACDNDPNFIPRDERSTSHRENRYGCDGPLHIAAVCGLVDITSRLRQRGYAPGGLCGSKTPLALAAGRGYWAVVNALLMTGAASDIDCEGFWWAVSRGHKHLVDRLLKESKFDVNCRNHKATPFGEAVAQGHLEIAKLFLATGKVDVNVRLQDNNQTPLCNAAAAGKPPLVKLLLAEDVDLNAAGDDGTTALWHAAANGHDAVVKLLLQQEDLDVNFETKDRNNKRTALEAAEGSGHTAVVQLLLADPRIRRQRFRNKESKKPAIPPIPVTPRKPATSQKSTNAQKPVNPQQPVKTRKPTIPPIPLTPPIPLLPSTPISSSKPSTSKKPSTSQKPIIPPCPSYNPPPPTLPLPTVALQLPNPQNPVTASGTSYIPYRPPSSPILPSFQQPNPQEPASPSRPSRPSYNPLLPPSLRAGTRPRPPELFFDKT